MKKRRILTAWVNESPPESDVVARGWLMKNLQVRTVKVTNVSLSASEQDIREFFSFSGEIEYIDIQRENERAQNAFVTFKDSQGAETAVLLSGATIVDQCVTIALAPEYTLPHSANAPSVEQPAVTQQQTPGVAESTIQKAEDVVSSMLAKGFILGKDTINKAKAFDEKLQFTSTAAAKAATIDQKIGLTEKISLGTTLVNEKVKDLDQKFQVSEKTKTAFATAEQTVSEAGSAVMKNRYVLTGTAWATGLFSKVTKAAGEVGQKTMEKVAEGEKSGQTESTREQPPSSHKGATTGATYNSST
ncbi:binding partner of acd11 1 [Artemisia annua]|uniref:Binding partner of acd11 1 n=1 Tax=Artemisia annua TaxID=35608 RepID=A0A2U1MTC5_ARTAN|nr:binding partner of acd11 1 [Artemisia annua]